VAIAEGVHRYGENRDRASIDGDLGNRLTAGEHDHCEAAGATVLGLVIHRMDRDLGLLPIRAERCKPFGLSRGVADHSAADRHILPLRSLLLRSLLLRGLLRIRRKTGKHEKRHDSQGTHVIAPFAPTNLAINNQPALTLQIRISTNEIVKAGVQKNNRAVMELSLRGAPADGAGSHRPLPSSG
jgi:hypothetical protein